MRWFDLNSPILGSERDGATPRNPAMSTRMLDGKPVNAVDAQGRLTVDVIGDGHDLMKWVRIPFAALPPERFPHPRDE